MTVFFDESERLVREARPETPLTKSRDVCLAVGRSGNEVVEPTMTMEVADNAQRDVDNGLVVLRLELQFAQTPDGDSLKAMILAKMG